MAYEDAAEDAFEDFRSRLGLEGESRWVRVAEVGLTLASRKDLEDEGPLSIEIEVSILSFELYITIIGCDDTLRFQESMLESYRIQFAL
jgi:hypothetical protein